MPELPLQTPAPDAPTPVRPAKVARTSPRRLLADRVARWTVTAGGMAIIASILGILVFIVIEVMPLLGGASVRPGVDDSVPERRPRAVAVDEYRTLAVTLSEDGMLRVHRMADGDTLSERPLLADDPAGEPVGLVSVVQPPGSMTLGAATVDGRIVLQPVGFDVSFDGDDRKVDAVLDDPVIVEADPSGAPVRLFSGRLADDGSAAVAAVRADGTLIVAVRSVRQNFLTGETEGQVETFETAAPELTSLVLDAAGHNLFGGGPDGSLSWWTIGTQGPAPARIVPGAGRAPVTALALLIGDRSLVVGRRDGTLAIWFPVRQDDESQILTRVREFPGRRQAIEAISPSRRDKGFVAVDAAGRLGLYYSTSARVLWEGQAPVERPTALTFSPRGDAAILAGERRLASLRIHNPHPQVGWRALFGKVWYEGYPGPQYVWQSSGGSDAFEPKLSLTPLMIGTLKGTIYSLLLAVPLGVLGAMYTALFMHPRLKRLVKPTVEIMAALPSVVLGFLAGLWLAPRVEHIVPALALMAIVLPATLVLIGWGWRALPPTVRGRYPAGSEALLYMAVIVGGVAACLALNAPVERWIFGGDFQAALLETTGLRYDQRNAIVVGLAMGFAVIPIIFSIAEDAFSNVPRNLVSGSLALGANAWQTATRVVLPTASPGIFSAIMIGFGRAVGETMIVLMATGNTPVLDWSPFIGFRTLSANIAVEIPEAPFGGTLYRTLFLAALILFVFTFAINTGAELVRQRLRKRYSQL